MKEYNDLSGVVFKILGASKDARDDDTELYILVCNHYNPEATKRPFGEVLRHRKEYGLPKFESVSRVRRKIQENNANLQSSEKVLDGKFEKYKKVKDWAVNE